MSDVAPALLEKLQDLFESGIKASGKLAKLEAKNRSGKATHRDALEYAQTVGEILQMTFRECIRSEDLPDGMLYYNIADRAVKPMLIRACEITSAYVTEVQQNLNEAAGIRLKAVVPEINMNRIDGIISRLSDGE